MEKRTLTLVALAGLIGWAGCGSPSSKEPRKSETPTVKTSLEQVEFRPVPVVYESIGTVRSRLESTLASKVLGQVLAVRVREGDHVKQGQTLVEIEARDSGAQLGGAQAGIGEADSALAEVEESIRAAHSGRDAAQANATLAETTFHRFQELLQRKSVSRQEFDEAEARYRSSQAEVARAEAMVKAAEAKKSQVLARKRQAEAAVQRAQVHVDFSTVRAPFSGLVTGRHVEPGDLAAPGVPLLTMEDDGRYRLESLVEESRIDAVRPGSEVRVRIDAVQRELSGKVDEVVPQADSNTRSFTVKIALPPQDGLRSGMFGRALFTAGERTLLTVPGSAVARKGQLTGVYAVDGQDRAWFRLIRTGKRFDDRIEVLSGLSEGDRVVVQPDSSIQDGTKIEPSGQ